MSYDELYNTLDVIDAPEVTVDPFFPKFQGMFWIFAEALLVTVLGLRCIEKGGRASRILAMIGLGFGALSVLLQLLLVWEAFPTIESSGFFSYSLSTMGKITSFTTVTMVASIVGALVVRIKGNDKLVSLLKIVSVFSGFGIWLITTIMIFTTDFEDISKIMNLEGVFSACFMTGWITALVLSKINQKDGTKEVGEKKETVTNNIVESVKPEPIVQTEPVQIEVEQAVEPEPNPASEPEFFEPVQEENVEPPVTPPEVSFENKE